MAGNRLIKVLLERYGQTYASEAGIRITKNSPAVLYQLLNLSLLLNTRIAPDNAPRAARALIEAGLTTPRKMATASWQERVDVISWHGYVGYDENTVTTLGATAERLLRDFDGDLRKLRKASGRDPWLQKALLKRLSGIGPTGADIFLREIQSVWVEAYPYADERVQHAASTLGLPSRPGELAACVSQVDFPRLTAALMRVDLDQGYDLIRQAA